MTLDDVTEFGSYEEQYEQGYPPQRRGSQYGMQDGMQMVPYSPFSSRSPDSVMADRMLTVKRPPKDKIVSGEIWITEAGLSEIFSLMPISKADQIDIMDDFYRIQMMASGELNRKIIDSRQDRLLARLLIQKSRLDAVEGGNVNERGWWGTRIEKIEQILRTSEPQRPKGFIERLVTGGR